MLSWYLLTRCYDMLLTGITVLIFWLQVVKNRCHSCSPIDIAQLLSIRANCSYERVGDKTNVHFDFNAVFPGVAFSVTPINPLPIVPTALSKNLGSPLSISEVQGEPKSGQVIDDCSFY